MVRWFYVWAAHRYIQSVVDCVLYQKNGAYDAYWVNTSSNGLVNFLLQSGNAEIKQAMEALLRGESIEAEIDEQIVFSQLDDSVSAVWSLLLAADI